MTDKASANYASGVELITESIREVDTMLKKLGAHIGEVPDTAKLKGAAKKKSAAPTAQILTAEIPPAVASFEKCDIRVSQILTCTVPDFSEKLLILTIDIGNGQTREFAAGIAKHYKSDELIGRRIMTILNLKPRPMADGRIVSNAMLFCGSHSKGEDGEIVCLCTPPQDAPPGTRVVPLGYTDSDPRPLAPASASDPKKNFSRVLDILTAKDGMAMLGDIPLVAGEYGPVKVDVPDGSHIG